MLHKPGHALNHATREDFGRKSYFPVLIPPCAFVYSSSNWTEEPNGSVISLYESCMFLGVRSGGDGGSASDSSPEFGARILRSASDQVTALLMAFGLIGMILQRLS